MEKNRTKPGQYSFLLVSLVSLFTLSPIFYEVAQARILASVLTVGILAASLYAISDCKRYFKIACILGVAGLIFELFVTFSETEAVNLFAYAAQVPFFVLITAVLFGRLLSAPRVTTDIIFGAISVYFLLGLTWGFLYQGVELLAPGSFSQGLASEDLRSKLFYFSFITMTTIGFGDIVPINPIARSFSMLQGVTGQMYIAILVARLVALQVVTKEKE